MTPKNIFYFCRAALSWLFSFLPTQALESVCRFFSKCASNAENYYFEWNGEDRLIAKFAASRDQNASCVVYDVGANIGLWSAALLARRPNARVYAFEMIPEFADKAARLLSSYGNAQVFNAPLSDGDNEIEAFQHDGGAAITENIFHPGEAKIHKIRTRSGDDFIRERALEPPDFIKIDVDGHEMKVLKGLRETIRAARPYVQFEYSFRYVYERVFLKDVFAYFEDMDYELYQIFPTKLVRRTYRPSLENFWTVNYLARPKDRPLP